jgi:acyl-CoA reductase-like NAD-dependent aldehyde dehydrogenase
MSIELIVRPPILARDVVDEIGKILNFEELFPHLKFVDMERSLFTEGFLSIADAVLFTGRYNNAKIVRESCPNALFIYNGAGVNPIVVTKDADIDLAVEKTVEMKIFNSGQDCAGSDVILVSNQIIESFKEKIIDELKKIKIGNYKNKEVRVGSLVKSDHLPAIQDFFDANAEKLVYGGKIDFKEKIVYPTIIINEIDSVQDFKMTEFFSPVFYILTFERLEDLSRYFNHAAYSDYAMYVSIFGDTSIQKIIPNSVILENKIVNDVERGNNPYGGYGPRANYVSSKTKTSAHPLLISKELRLYINANVK